MHRLEVNLKNLRILALGDIVGPRSVEHLKRVLWKYRTENKIDMVIANGENSSEPNGIDKQTALAIFDSGVDVITTGNHIWRKQTVFTYLDDEERILRPLNYSSLNPGHGDTVFNLNGYRVLVMNVLGENFMDDTSSPFEAVEKSLSRNRGRYDLAILDIHAECTGEKKALAYHFSKELSVAFGTHTHVQTSDAQILCGRCGYISDLGMCGDDSGILGVKKEAVIHRLRTKMLVKFDFATEGKIECNGAIFEIDTDSFNCVGCQILI